MKTKFLTLIAVCVALCFTGCSTADKFNSLHIGMSQSDVVGVLGQPDSKSAQGDIEYYTYYLAADGMSRDQPYLVRFVNGKVESFGRFAQLFDIYNRPVNGQAPALGYAMPGVPSSIVAPAPAASAAPVDLADQLQKLKTLKDQGALTDEEYQRAKNLLLQPQK